MFESKGKVSVLFAQMMMSLCFNVCSSGGFSDTYAALCDFNEMPFIEEIQWVCHCCIHTNNYHKCKNTTHAT